MEDVKVLSKKLETILNSFLKNEFSKGSTAHFEMLISQLSKKEHINLLQTPVILNWIDACVNILLNDYNALHSSVISFMFKLCATLADNEWLIIGLREQNSLESIAKIVSQNIDSLTPSIKLGHIRMLSAISKHSLGLRWIRFTKSWQYLVKYCSSDHTLYVVREASALIYEILYKFSVKTYDEDLCREILAEILKPIDNNVYKDTSDIVNVDDTDLQRQICATLDLLSVIFQKMIECCEKTPIPHLCEVHHTLGMNIWKLTEMTLNEYFLGKIMKAQTCYNFAMLIYEKWKDDEIDPLEFNQFGVNFFNIMKFCIARRSCVNLLKLSKYNHCLWKKLGSKVPTEIVIENTSIQFENQLIMIHIMPVLCIAKNPPGEEEVIFDQYIMKLFSISSDFTIRLCYSIRDVLLDNPSLTAHLAYKSIHGVLSMKAILSSEQAVVVFQALVYALKEFAVETYVPDGSVTKPLPQEDLVVTIPQVLYATLMCLHTLIERYNITWKESIETMCLVNVLLVILNKSNLSPLIVVQGIKLIQLSIEHFLSPNMALLVDDLKGSALQNLGPTIVKHFHHTEWEVRDSTLELVASVVSISRLKFPAFQQYLLEHDISSLVHSIIKSDPEPYVRASGLKCLTQMIAVNLIWEKSLVNLNFIDYLFCIINNDTEGIVRKEAVTCITQMYVHRRINSQTYPSLYSTLTQCAVHDLHWEVKINALYFWEKEIFFQFTNQGMIDGTFPTVTFSKEKKKIVTLTEAEIILRIKKVLDELSQIGCLDVILKCLNDDCDLEAVKVAVRITKGLFEKLEKYNYEKALEGEKTAPETSGKHSRNQPAKESTSATQSNSQTQCYENMSCVINEIVSTNDMQLLIDSYKQQMNVESAKPANDEKPPTPMRKNVNVVTPREFIDQLKNTNLDKLVECRNNWYQYCDDLDSLLDDLLLTTKAEKAYQADCY